MIKQRLLALLAAFVCTALFVSQSASASHYDSYTTNYDYPAYAKSPAYMNFYAPNSYNSGSPYNFYGVYASPATSKYSSSASLREQPDKYQFPKESLTQTTRNSLTASNFDSSSASYDYRGPMYERQIAYVDDFAQDSLDKSGFFSSKSQSSLRHKISATLTEKYLGATESLFTSNQNRRTESATQNQDTSYSYDGGSAFGKQRVYDSTEYGKDSYSSPYYYRPNYNSDSGYYNWRY